MDVLNYNFKEYGAREAFVVENKIVYFGSYKEKTTFVLEQVEGTEKLSLVR